MAKRTEFELFTKLSIGQYMPTDSVVHRIDPRIKLGLCILLICAAVGLGSVLSTVFLLIVVVFGLLLTGVQLRLAFAALRPVAVFLIILALIQVFAVPKLGAEDGAVWQWRFLQVTHRSITAGVLLILRFVVVVLGLSLFSFCTTTTELTHGIEHILRPLQRIGFPAHELALTVNIAVRFIPILMGEAEWLMKAQASRGADFGYGTRRGLFRRIKRLFPLFIPLFAQSLKHAYNLSEAMEARCYVGGRGRTHFIRLHANAGDYIALSTGIIVACIAIMIHFFHMDQHIWSMWKALMRGGIH
jgi:energy-coupling factor transport system permease protein